MNSQVKNEAYQNYQVFELIEHMRDYYEGISYTSFSFIPHGAPGFCNHATDVYMFIRSTFDSIKTLLNEGRQCGLLILERCGVLCMDLPILIKILCFKEYSSFDGRFVIYNCFICSE